MGRMTKHPLTLFALRLRRARLNSVLGDEPVTQAMLAKLIGVGHATVERWETGRTLPMPHNMKKVAKVLGMDEDDVWLDTYMMPPDMVEFLTTTVEGKRMVGNMRKIMNQLERTQKPTTRRGVPEGVKLKDVHYRDLSHKPGWARGGYGHTRPKKKGDSHERTNQEVRSVLPE